MRWYADGDMIAWLGERKLGEDILWKVGPQKLCDHVIVLYVICLALSIHKNHIWDKSFTFKNLVQAFVQLDFICYLLYISSHVINSKFEHKDLSTHTYSLLIHTLFPFCFCRERIFLMLSQLVLVVVNLKILHLDLLFRSQSRHTDWPEQHFCRLFKGEFLLC